MPLFSHIGEYLKTNLSKLHVLQNKAVGIVTGSSRRSIIENMFRWNGITNLDFINTSLVGKFMYKVVLLFLLFFFRHNYHLHDRYTRGANHLHGPLASTNPSKTGIRFQGVIIWNQILCADTNPDRSEEPVKIMLKKLLTSNYKQNKFIMK